MTNLENIINSYDVVRLPISNYTIAILHSFLRYKCMQNKNEDFSQMTEDCLLPDKLAAQSLVFLFCYTYADILHEPCCNEDFTITDEGPTNNMVADTYFRFASKLLIELNYLKSSHRKKKKTNSIEEYHIEATEVMNEHLLQFINNFTKKYSKMKNEDICNEAKNLIHTNLNTNEKIINHKILLKDF